MESAVNELEEKGETAKTVVQQGNFRMRNTWLTELAFRE